MATVAVEGIDDLANNLRGLSRALQTDIIRIAANKAGARMREEIRYAILATRLIDTGKLFDSIRISTKPILGGGITARVGTGKAFYGKFYEYGFEYGTRHQVPRPFMRPAFKAGTPLVLEDMNRYFKEAIESVAGRALYKKRRFF